MSSRVPNVMVSSTFYDLRQIRADLAEFIENDLGYHALMSEHPSFPVDPDADTIENCRRRVEREADILVLVVGGRYGYVDKQTNRSITNIEYLVARAKKIPIYTFIEKSILTILPYWERNPDADFSHAVSDARVFHFVQEIRSVERAWTYEFERAQDIVNTLRSQFAYLMYGGLQLSHQLSSERNPYLQRLSGKALRIILDKPEAWEYRLFSQALVDEVASHAHLRREHKQGLIFGSGDHIDLTTVVMWLNARHEEIRRLIDALTIIFDNSLEDALGPRGIPGDGVAIASVARELGELYRHAIEWSLRVRRAHLPECFRPVARELALYTEDLIEKIEGYGPHMLQQIEQALLAPRDGTPRELNLILKPDLRNVENFSAALDQAERDCFGL